MFKKLNVFVAFTCIALFASSAFADDVLTGNKRKGKYLLRKIYKACKKRGEVDTTTPPVSPADRKMAEWKTIYQLIEAAKDQKMIDEKMAKFGCKPEWKKINAKTRLDIFTYMYKHAQDSSTPAKCK